MWMQWLNLLFIFLFQNYTKYNCHTSTSHNLENSIFVYLTKLHQCRFLFSLFFCTFHPNNTCDKHCHSNTCSWTIQSFNTASTAMEEEKYPPLQPSFNSAFYDYQIVNQYSHLFAGTNYHLLPLPGSPVSEMILHSNGWNKIHNKLFLSMCSAQSIIFDTVTVKKTVSL